jgi:hemerythrin superfamily protein
MPDIDVAKPDAPAQGGPAGSGTGGTAADADKKTRAKPAAETAQQAGQAASSGAGPSDDGQAKSQAEAQGQDKNQTQAKSGEGQPEAIRMLMEDHRKVEKLFGEYEAADDRRKEEIVRQACRELILHTLLEEEIFYPACRQAASDEEPLDEAQVEHDSAKLLIRELMDGDRDDQYREARFIVLAEQIRRHVTEEEEPSQGVFAKARAKNVATEQLARRMRERRQELQGQPLRPTRPRSFQSLQPSPHRSYEENEMSNQYQGRDERGRFTDDDDRGGRSRGGRDEDDRGYRSRGRDDNHRGQGGWFGDSRGHSEASRRGWEDRGGGRSGGGRDRDYEERSYRARDRDDGDRGQGGWFGDSRGHAEASRRGWERSDHEGSGWYGDSRGHSEASRKGWDNPDHGPSGWYGDPRGHSEASRRGWERSDHEGSGWYGDSRGHSEASRRGWEDRDGARGGGGRGGRDEDDRGYRMRGRDDDDDGRGWHGDPRGHAEAARRGWENRR